MPRHESTSPAVLSGDPGIPDGATRAHRMARRLPGHERLGPAARIPPEHRRAAESGPGRALRPDSARVPFRGPDRQDARREDNREARPDRDRLTARVAVAIARREAGEGAPLPQGG